MHSKHPLNKIYVISPLSHKDEQHTETKTSYKMSEFEKSISTKLPKFNNEQKNKRPVSLSFNLGKIMPKTISHDKQELYEQNIKLKDNLKYLNNQIAKLKTRVIASEHEAQKIIQATYSDITKSNFNLSMTKNQGVSDSQKSKISWMWLQSQGLLKKQVIKLRQQNTNLKQTNQKLRKSLKYTQIQELTIENKHLSEECTRLKKLLETTTTENRKESSSFSSDLKTTKQELIKHKQQNTFLSFQLRSKVREIDLLRDQLSKVKQRQAKTETHLNQLKSQIKTLLQESSKQRENKQKTQVQNPKQIQNSQQIIIKEQKTEEKTIQNHPKKHLEQETVQLPIKKTIQLTEEQNNIIYHYKNRVSEEIVQIPQKKQQKSNQQKLKEQNLRKIQQLREILTYRFKSQRYTFDDLLADLTNVKLTFLTKEQLIGLLSSQPFFLKDQELKFVLSYILEAQKNKQQIEINSFKQKISKFIEEFKLIDEENEEYFLKKWKRLLYPIRSSLYQKAKEKGFVTKPQFKSFIVETQVSSQQMEILLGEASIESNSMNNINLAAFIQKILHY